MQFWEKYVDNGSLPTACDSSQWLPVLPGIWDDVGLAYKNCSGDLSLNSLHHISEAVDPITFNIIFEVVNIPNNEAKFKITNFADFHFTERDLSSFPVGVYSIIHQITGFSEQWDGPVNFKLLGIDTCNIIIKCISFTYTDKNGNIIDSGQVPSEYSIQVDPVGPIELCSNNSINSVTFSAFNYLNAYEGKFKISYLSSSSTYIPIYSSSTNESIVTLDIPIYYQSALITTSSIKVELVPKNATNFSEDILATSYLNFNECNSECKPFNTSNWIGIDATTWEYTPESSGFISKVGNTHIASTYTLVPSASKSFTVTFELLGLITVPGIPISWRIAGEGDTTFSINKSVGIQWRIKDSTTDYITNSLNIKWLIKDSTWQAISKSLNISWPIV